MPPYLRPCASHRPPLKVRRHGRHQLEFPQTQSRLPVSRNRPPGEGLLRGQPRSWPRASSAAASATSPSRCRPPRVKAMHEAVDELAAARRSAATARSKAMSSCARPIVRQPVRAASASPPTRSSSPTARNATPATSSTSSARATRIAITDPVYPVYVDTNVMAGNTGDADDNGAYAGLLYLPVQRG